MTRNDELPDSKLYICLGATRMVQSKSRKCLFIFFLLSQIVVTCLWASQVVASLAMPLDIERDLVEVKFRHSARLNLAAQIEAEPLWAHGKFGDSDCQFFDRSQLLGIESNEFDLIPKLSGSFGVTKPDSKVDISPQPRGCLEEETKDSPTASLEASSKGTSVNGAQAEAPIFHQQNFDRKEFWLAASEYVIAGREGLVGTIGFAEHRIEGLYIWAAEKIEASQIQTVDDNSAAKSMANSLGEIEHSLAAIERVVIPIFLVPDYDEHVALLNPPASASIPMFVVEDVVEDVQDSLPADLFADKTEVEVSFSADSIKLQTPARDPYWQYYEDCDRWGVLIVEAQPVDSAPGVPAKNQTESDTETEDRSPAVALGPGALLYHVIESNSNLLWAFSLSPQRKLIVKPIEQSLGNFLDHSEEQRRAAALVPTQPTSPWAASKLISKPALEQLRIGSLDLSSLLSGEALSQRIRNLQNQYGERIGELMARSQAMEVNQRNESLEFIASQCRRLARTINLFADSISAAADEVALNDNKKKR